MVGRFLIALSVVALSLAQTAEQKVAAPPAELPKQVVPAPEAPQQRPIRVQVNEVIVPVTVTDEKGAFVSNLDAKDFRIFDDSKFSGYLVTYGNEAELAVNTTSDAEPMVDKLRKVKPGGGAALYDAIYMACQRRHVIAGEPFDPRRVLIIIGDG